MRTVFLNEEPRAIGEASALARVVAEMRQQGVAALPVYDHATADGCALVRLPETLFAGEGTQRPQICAEKKPHLLHARVSRSRD